MENKTLADLPELAQKLGSDQKFRDTLIWTLLINHPTAFVRLVNGEDFLELGPQASAVELQNALDGHIMDRSLRLPNDPAEYNTKIISRDNFNLLFRACQRRGGKVEAIKILRGMLGLGLKEAKDYIEFNFKDELENRS